MPYTRYRIKDLTVMGHALLSRYQGQVTAGRYLREGFGRQFLCLDLMNSLYRDGFGNVTDFLLDSSWVRVFLRHWGLRLQGPTSAAHAEMAELRTHLRQMAEKVSSGRKTGRGDLKLLNQALSTPAYQPGLVMGAVPGRSVVCGAASRASPPQIKNLSEHGVRMDFLRYDQRKHAALVQRPPMRQSRPCPACARQTRCRNRFIGINGQFH